MRGFQKVSLDTFKKDYKLEDVEEIYNGINIPKRQTKCACGYDIETPYAFTLKPNEIIKIPTGIKVYFNEDEMFSLYVRSSIGFKYNVRLVNQVGIFEADYYNNETNEGQIYFKIQNHSEEEVSFVQNERIIQGVFTKFLTVDNDEAIGIRKGGLGSTSKEEK